MIGNRLSFIMQVQKFKGAPLKWGKNMPNFGQFSASTDFLIANISGIRQHIQNRKDVRTRAITPAFDKKSPVYFGSLTTCIQRNIRQKSAIFYTKINQSHRCHQNVRMTVWLLICVGIYRLKTITLCLQNKHTNWFIK